MSIRGTTQLLGLIGDPVSHSVSPIMQNAALLALDLDYVYLPFAVKPQDLPAAIMGLEAIGVQGFNVTIPHKQAVLNHLQQIEAQAQSVGAVNTVYRCAIGHGWAGTNTDIAGFLHPLLSLSHQAKVPYSWSDCTALILGSGGAARAVIAACVQLGIPTLQVIGRSLAKLVELQRIWPQVGIHLWSDLSKLLPHCRLLINTTPIGMQGKSAALESPLSDQEIRVLPAAAIVYDLIYIPTPTPLLKTAAAAGYTCIDGLEMLVQQGASALSLWLGGKPVPVDIMRQAAQQHLGLR
jgi:shikimate dehydrogenase